MHLLSFSFVFSVIFLLKFLLSEISSQSIFSKYQVPCFEEDKKLAKCDKSECDLTTDSGKIKLFRLPGYRVSDEKSYLYIVSNSLIMKEAKGQCLKRTKVPDSIGKSTRLCIPSVKEKKVKRKRDPWYCLDKNANVAPGLRAFRYSKQTSYIHDSVNGRLSAWSSIFQKKKKTDNSMAVIGN